MRHMRIVTGLVATLVAASSCTTTTGGNGAGGGAASTSAAGGASTATSTGSTASASTSAAGGASTATSTGPTTSTSTSTASSSSSGGPCSPHSSCPSPPSAVGCVGLTDNTGKTKFGLRMSELDMTKPTSLSTGIVASTLTAAMSQNEAACNLDGTGTFNWLLQFDTTAGTLTTGGAKPVADATQGYSFDTDVVMGFSLAPVVFQAAPDSNGNFTTTTGMNLAIPVFLDPAATQLVLLPLKSVTIQAGKLSDGDNCIGSYNAATLDPANSCQPDAAHPAFTDGAALAGYINLSDANNVVISALSETLCAFLAGGNQAYVTQNGAVTVCKKDSSGKILYMGDWCSTTNMAGGCADSVQMTANFAASSVIIN